MEELMKRMTQFDLQTTDTTEDDEYYNEDIDREYEEFIVDQFEKDYYEIDL